LLAKADIDKSNGDDRGCICGPAGAFLACSG